MFEVQKMHQEQMSIGGLEAFRDALAKIGVDVRDYPEHQMMLLDYNQIECVKNHPVVNECRGLVMAYDGSIVRKGFNRFYNLGENGVDQFDFANSVAFEKADGSLMFVYFCPQTDKWEIGTRGTAFAEGPNEWFGTFRNFMLNAMGRTEAQFQADCNEHLRKHKTYLFEAIGPDNRIVTKYNHNMMVFLSVVDKVTGEETLFLNGEAVDIFTSMQWNVRSIGQYVFATQEDCMKTLNELSGLQEGYVVWNKVTGARVKVKSPAYLAAHRLRGQNGLTINSICELVAMNEQDEYLAVFPEDAHKFTDAIGEYLGMKLLLVNNYLAADNYMQQFENTGANLQKEFALYVKDLPLSAVMFKARRNGTDVIHEFNQFPVSKRADWLKEQLPAKAVVPENKQYIAVDIETDLG